MAVLSRTVREIERTPGSVDAGYMAVLSCTVSDIKRTPGTADYPRVCAQKVCIDIQLVLDNGHTHGTYNVH